MPCALASAARHANKTMIITRRFIFWLTSKMSHDGSWRAACGKTKHLLGLHFGTPPEARGVTDPGVGSGALLGGFFLEGAESPVRDELRPFMPSGERSALKAFSFIGVRFSPEVQVKLRAFSGCINARLVLNFQGLFFPLPKHHLRVRE